MAAGTRSVPSSAYEPQSDNRYNSPELVQAIIVTVTSELFNIFMGSEFHKWYPPPPKIEAEKLINTYLFCEVFSENCFFTNLKKFQVGIVSFGPSPCDAAIPAVYTRFIVKLRFFIFFFYFSFFNFYIFLYIFLYCI